MARIRALLAIAALVVPLTAGGALGSTGTTCSWPLRLDPTAVNTAYPDQNANYWITDLPAVPGETLTIKGEYPHSRYMSFVSYNAALQSVDGLNDTRIDPDIDGSVNPFVAGNSRIAPKRNYAATVVFDAPPPSGRANNTLYTTSVDGTKSAQAFLLAYRVFRADAGMDDRGGVGLPTITINLPGGQSVPLPPCDTPGVPPNDVNDAFANGDNPTQPSFGGSGTNPPTWHKFYNFPTAIVYATDSDQGHDISDLLTPYTTMLPKGGFADNPDNNYVSTFINRARGKLLVIHAKLPTTPRTYDGEQTMGSGQLRYWSLCSNHGPSQRYYACLADDQVVTDANGFYTIVVSQPQDRPSCARAEHGVTWLAWGVTNDSVLIIRNMLPQPSFANSIQAAHYGHEAEDMGDYYPASRYLANATAFPCPPPQAAARIPFEHVVHDDMECGNMHGNLNRG